MIKEEFDGVDHQNVGQTRNFINRNYPKSKKYKLIDKFVTDLLVPGEKFVSQGKTSDTRG